MDQLPQVANEQPVRLESSKRTYSVSIPDFVPAALATDSVILVGYGTRQISLTNVRISGSASTSTFLGCYFYKRTTPNSGGTFSQITPVKHDSSDSQSLAVINTYTANPSSVGTGVLLRSGHLGFPSPSNPVDRLIWDFGNRASKCPKLANANESFCLSFNGQTIPSGANLHITIEWTEEG